MNAELLLKAFDIGSPELKPSLLHWVDNQPMLTKKDIDGVYKTKPAFLDSNNRYVWKDQLKP